MARGDILCPIDGTVIGLPSFSPKNLVVADLNLPGGHIHLLITGTIGPCANGHTWTGELLLQRLT